MSVRETSKESYTKLMESGELTKGQAEVYSLLAGLDHGMTDREIAQALGYEDPNKIRPRRFELADLRLIDEKPKRKCSLTNRNAYEWVAMQPVSPEEIKRRRDILNNKEKQITCPMCKGTGKITKIEV